MAGISASMVKQLREKTGAGMMDCKNALSECDGDMEQAIDFLRKKGLATAQKRAGRAMTEGIIHSYIHLGGKLGVLVEVNCWEFRLKMFRKISSTKKKRFTGRRPWKWENLKTSSIRSWRANSRSSIRITVY